MKITSAAAIALAIFILPLAAPAPAAPQDQPPSVPNAQNGTPMPGPGQDLPSEVYRGSELFQTPEPYQPQEPFCSDDIVSNIICRPAAKYTKQMAAAMCESFRDGNLPNAEFGIGVGIANVTVTDMQHYCDRFFPFMGTLCQFNSGSCKLLTPSPMGSECECNDPQLGLVVGTVLDK